MRYLVAARANELQLDIDQKKLPRNFHYVFKLLKRRIGVRKKQQFRSKSGYIHIIVTLSRNLPATERIVWQLALGSDVLRELHNLERVVSGKCKNPIFLSMKKPRGRYVKCNCIIPNGILPILHRCYHVVSFQPNINYRKSKTKNL